MRITQMEARRALRDPGGRAAMDALPELVTLGAGVGAPSAGGHRGPPRRGGSRGVIQSLSGARAPGA